MRRIDIALSANGSTPPQPLDARRNQFTVSVSVAVSGASPALVADVTYTYDDVQAAAYNPSTGNWFTIAGLTALSAANGDALLTKPCTAVRMTISGYSAGKATMTIIQAGDGP